MPDLFDRETGQKVDALPPDEAAAGVASGKLALKADTGPVTLAGRDGRTYTVAPDKVAGALGTGAYRLLSPDEELQRTVAREEKAKGLAGSVGAAADSALNQLLFGTVEAGREATETPEQAKRREAEESYHSTARALGGVAGFGGSLLLGGEFFKGAELAGEAASHLVSPAAEVAKAGLATRLAAKGVDLATQGAALSAPAALVQAVAGDPKRAAETLLWGVGVGALLGGGEELASSAVRGAGEAAAGLLDREGVRVALNDWANNRTLKAVGAERSQLSKLSKERIGELADFVHDEGLLEPGQSRQDLGDVIERAHDRYGKEIGDTIASLDGHVAQKFLHEEGLSPGELGARIKTELDSPELRMPMNADQAHALDIVIQSANRIPTQLVNGREVVRFEDAQNFVSSLRRKWAGSVSKALNEGGARGLETVTPLDQMKAAAYGAARNSLHEAADRVAVAADSPELVGALAKAKTKYAKLAELEKFAGTLDRQQAGNRLVGLTDFLSMGAGSHVLGGIGGAVGALAGPAGMAAGTAIGKVAGVPLTFLAKHWVEDKGLVALSALAKRAAKDGPEVFSAVMASEGAKRLDATLGGVQDAVKRMAQEGLTESGSRRLEHMTHLLGGETTGLTHDQQFARVGERLARLAANPEALVAAAHNISSPFATTSPDIQAEYAAKMQEAIRYLNDAMPKPALPPGPFAPSDWTPTPKELLSFHDRAEVVVNPMRAIDRMMSGTLSRDHLNALATVYPQVYQAMKQTVLEFAARHPEVKLPLPERRSVAMFLGMPLDPTEAHVDALQAAYAAHPPAASPAAKPPKGKIKDRPSAASAFESTQGPPPPA